MGFTFISVDIEASGPIPGVYSMLSFGACVVGNSTQSIYRELKPINDNFVPEALAISGFTMEGAKHRGSDPEKAMKDFAYWLDNVAAKGKPKFVGFPAGFDWPFIDHYFHVYLGRNPFGIAPVDIRSVYFGLFRLENGLTTRKEDMKQKLGVTAPHTHNALDDAVEQAEMFARMLELRDKMV